MKNTSSDFLNQSGHTLEPICERLVTDTEKLTADSESSAQTELYELYLMIAEVWEVS